MPKTRKEYFIRLFIRSIIFIICLIICFKPNFYEILEGMNFFEVTNVVLRCSNCTDKLCTQYCKKLRK